MNVVTNVVLTFVYVFLLVSFPALGTIFTGHAVGQQVPAELAQFSVFAVMVISAAKYFGAACVAWSKSLITRFAGGIIAAACAVVTGCLTWSFFMKLPGSPMAAAMHLGVSPETYKLIWVTNNLIEIEVFPLFVVICSRYFWEIAREIAWELARRGRSITT